MVEGNCAGFRFIPESFFFNVKTTLMGEKYRLILISLAGVKKKKKKFTLCAYFVQGSAFVIFPVQTITTVDSRVVQLGYLEGHLLVSSLSRCYLCDTDREKFWRVGNKERDGEYGACFLPQHQTGSRTPGAGTAHLVYCARPGSRIWEANFSGEVLSTHQFKQLLACPALPLISYKYVVQRVSVILFAELKKQTKNQHVACTVP